MHFGIGTRVLGFWVFINTKSDMEILTNSAPLYLERAYQQ